MKRREQAKEETRKEEARKAEAQQRMVWRKRENTSSEEQQKWDREDKVTLMTWNCRGIKHSLSSTVGDKHTLREITDTLQPMIIFR